MPQFRISVWLAVAVESLYHVFLAILAALLVSSLREGSAGGKVPEHERDRFFIPGEWVVMGGECTEIESDHWEVSSGNGSYGHRIVIASGVDLELEAQNSQSKRQRNFSHKQLDIVSKRTPKTPVFSRVHRQQRTVEGALSNQLKAQSSQIGHRSPTEILSPTSPPRTPVVVLEPCPATPRYKPVRGLLSPRLTLNVDSYDLPPVGPKGSDEFGFLIDNRRQFRTPKGKRIPEFDPGLVEHPYGEEMDNDAIMPMNNPSFEEAVSGGSRSSRRSPVTYLGHSGFLKGAGNAGLAAPMEELVPYTEDFPIRHALGGGKDSGCMFGIDELHTECTCYASEHTPESEAADRKGTPTKKLRRFN